MDITGISTSLNAASLLTTQARPLESEPTDLKKTHEHREGGRGKHGRALGILRAEMRFALKAQFHARINVPQQGYAQTAQPASPDDVASEALGAARQIASESPTSAARALIQFRASVHESASIARQTVGESDDADDIDNAVATVDAGLDELEQEVAVNRESSASVLAVEIESKLRSTIRIRTHEGDIVRFDLKQVDQMSGTDKAVSTNENNRSVTEVSVSTSSRLKLHVNGDLNESELQAIQNVFAQAEAMADEFFGGDIGAAFNMAQGFEFDSEQLARVNLRFRMQQSTNIAYAETVSAPAIVTQPAVESAAPVAALPANELPIATEQPQPASPVAAEQPQPASPVAAEQVIPDTAVGDVGTPVASALSGFFDLVSDFMRSIGNGFDHGGNANVRLHYSESFKLELLRSVIQTNAPEASETAAANADAIINSVIEAAPGEASDA